MRIWRVERYSDQHSETWEKCWELFHLTKEGAEQRASKSANEALVFQVMENYTPLTYVAHSESDTFYLEPIDVIE